MPQEGRPESDARARLDQILAVLTEGLPESEKPRASAELIRAVREVYKEHHAELPEWLRQVIEE
jgi:uncharacterized protein (DUF2267 family)